MRDFAPLWAEVDLAILGILQNIYRQDRLTDFDAEKVCCKTTSHLPVGSVTLNSSVVSGRSLSI